MEKTRDVWSIVMIAHGGDIALKAEELLTSEGFMVKARPVSKSLADGNVYEILALRSEAREAQRALRIHGLL